MKITTVDQLKARIEAGEKINLVDVREDYERADFNIGGLHHRLGLIQEYETEPLNDWKDEEVIIYCRSGKRSATACLLLESAGFKKTVNVDGGVLAWIDKFGR
jgi:rhodanese-related sulfurtransferase